MRAVVNAILTNALPQNPELVYTLLHRQEVFAPFRDHPRYAELMDNVQVGRVCVGGGGYVALPPFLVYLKITCP